MSDEQRHWPDCRSEAEEAEWWDRHPEYAEEMVMRGSGAGLSVREVIALEVIAEHPGVVGEAVARAKSLKLGVPKRVRKGSR